MSADTLASAGSGFEDGLVDAATLDRLVDGGLDAGTRRQVLLQLERQPGGWRRCALAFLEAQAWREAMSDLVQEIHDPARPAAVAPLAFQPPAKSPRAMLPTYARAAGLLLAFALGWLMARGGHPASARNAPLAAEPESRPTTAITPAPAPSLAPELVQSQPPAPRPDPEIPATPSASPKPAPRTSLVRQLNSLPAGARAEVLPAPIRQNLMQHGFELEPTQELATVAIGSGRKLAVPVPGVRIRYVGNRTY